MFSPGSDVHVAQDFFYAGLPFWLTRPASDLGQTNILAVFQLSEPCYFGICFESHCFNYPIIYRGPASSTQKHGTILLYTCNFLCYLDPFALHASDENTSMSAHVQTSTRLQASNDRSGAGAFMDISHQHGAGKGRKPYGRKGRGVIRQ